jgi:hypothetical protein
MHTLSTDFPPLTSRHGGRLILTVIHYPRKKKVSSDGAQSQNHLHAIILQESKELGQIQAAEAGFVNLHGL